MSGRDPQAIALVVAKRDEVPGDQVPVVEHLTAMDRLPVSGARFTAVPPGVRGMGRFPVRAFTGLP